MFKNRECLDGIQSFLFIFVIHAIHLFEDNTSPLFLIIEGIKKKEVSLSQPPRLEQPNTQQVLTTVCAALRALQDGHLRIVM